MPVEFLIYRNMGFCTEGCMAHEKRTPVGEVSIAYRNGFPIKGLKVKSKK